MLQRSKVARRALLLAAAGVAVSVSPAHAAKGGVADVVHGGRLDARIAQQAHDGRFGHTDRIGDVRAWPAYADGTLYLKDFRLRARAARGDLDPGGRRRQHRPRLPGRRLPQRDPDDGDRRSAQHPGG